MKIGILTLTPLLLALTVACNKAHDASDGHDGHDHGDGGHDHAAHAHEATHGGDLLELGDHVAHMEVKYFESQGKVVVYLSDPEQEPLSIKDAPVLNLEEEAIQVTSKTGGVVGEACDKWVFEHEKLKGHSHGGRFRVQLNGKTYNPEWHPEHDHGDHDADDAHDHSSEEADGHDHDGHDHDAGHK